jgi:hypothetical protein
MRFRLFLAAMAAVLAAPSVAAAQGTTVGGPVYSSMELILGQPDGFPAFSKAKTYTTSFEALATATDAPTLLSVADGDATGGSKLGHISVRGKRLPEPLEATVGAAAFQPLDQSVSPLLTKFKDVTARAKTTVKLRQKVTRKSTGSYRKVVLVTLSTEMP